MKIIAIILVATLASACTMTNEKGEKVVLTAQTAPGLILAEMKKGCPSLVAAGNAAAAIATAMNAAAGIQGAINTVSNMASIGCSLLVPPPPPG